MPGLISVPPSNFEGQIQVKDWTISYDKAYIDIRRGLKIGKLAVNRSRRSEDGAEMSPSS